MAIGLPMQNVEHSIEIAPLLRPRMSVHDLVTPNFTMIGGYGLTWEPPEVQLNLFSVEAPGFDLLCARLGGQLHLYRNGIVAVARLPDMQPGLETKVVITITWSPGELFVRVRSTGYRSEQRIETPVTVPPFSLLEWLRGQGLEQRNTYATAVDVYIEVTNQLIAASEKVKRLAANNGFWDVHYEGQKIVGRTPKKETDIHPTIGLLLYDLDLVRGLQVVPEYDAGSGRLDFLISGWSEEDRRMVHVCVEFKLAHSRDLATGLLKQLPAYMRQRQTDFGVFGVISFGADYKYDPTLFSGIRGFKIDADTEMETALEIAAGETGLRNVRNVIFDVSHQVSPSKL